ncbi:DNA-binding protein P3A2-like isoform X2 [Patiria miniata]|uniref:Nuclear respiratory factor 1 NLS/DNA-binding dimerisation domain-containing protein n=1 Tax=Patiria miniata TaxID=46514 RepID=A0A914AWU4_PATMI|nr:DNA-binding protein P3A2-like isoform X2 [Patiria miniata]
MMMIGDDVSEPSSPESAFDDTDLLNSAMHDEVTAQLAAAGPIGVAAAAAIATGKKRKRPHSFETNPSIRKRQQTRLLRKLRATIDEYTTRVGQQAVMICCTPGKQETNFKVFGANPLDHVVRSCKSVIMSELDNALAQQTPPTQPGDNTNLYDLPPLVLDGIPTPVNKMTQAQLRAFIPLMLKYSTGRGKPGWGKESCRPVWWPSDLPWANVRSDVRTEDEKKKVSWTHALRTIVKNCYKHHGREDLLPEFNDDKDVKDLIQHQRTQTTIIPSHAVVQTINNPDGTVSLIQVDTGNTVATLTDVNQVQQVQQVQQMGQIQHVQLHHIPVQQQPQQQQAAQAVQTLADVAASQASTTAVVTTTNLPQAPQATPVSVEMNSEAAAHGGVATISEATLAEGTHIMLSSNGETMGTISSVGADGATQGIVIPASMYQSMVNSMQQGGQVQVHTQLPVHTVAVVGTQPTAMVQGQHIQQVVVPSGMVATTGQLQQQQQQQSGAVPLATQAVEG